jgi:hypothetical protein
MLRVFRAAVLQIIEEEEAGFKVKVCFDFSEESTVSIRRVTECSSCRW